MTCSASCSHTITFTRIRSSPRLHLPIVATSAPCSETGTPASRLDNRPPRDRQRPTLVNLNRVLRPVQREMERSFTAPLYPTVFVIGAPRTCTTLMSQLLAAAGGLNYISNFVARFYKAPAVGALIEKTLGLRDPAWSGDFLSSYGITKGLQEPHEFGFFWDRWFDLGQEPHKLTDALLTKIDVAGLKRELASVEAVFDRPVVYKNNTWCTLQSGFLSRLFPTSIFVACRREPLFVAQSLLLGRRTRYSDQNKWWSIRPSTYHELAGLSVWEQVAGQAIDVEHEMDAELRHIPVDRIVDVRYEELCRHPARLVEAVHEAVTRLGHEITEARPLAARFESTNHPRLSPEDWNELKRAVRVMLKRSRSRRTREQHQKIT